MNTPYWVKNSIFYHIYPLGLLGAPKINHFTEEPQEQLSRLIPWLDNAQELGATAIYLGPIFESTSHGYDTCDYFTIDRRLGTKAGMKLFCYEAHQRGLRIILDGVFNHCGRSFWAFQDVQQNGQKSSYLDWFMEINFSRKNNLGDPFTYLNWNGDDNLVKFNLSNPEIRHHLLEAVQTWMNEWQIDGLRLDAADCVQLDFWSEIRQFTSKINPDFWLMGEIVHGDYRKWIQDDLLHSVTNYECYKGLYSSFNEENLFEIAYSLNRQFGKEGIYQNFWLYNFVDNHDVSRISSRLKQIQHIYPLYALLYTIPGIPSVYYGSEFGVTGNKMNWSDENLRPALDLESVRSNPDEPDLFKLIKKLSDLRKRIHAMAFGAYQEAFVYSKQFGFWRISDHQKVLVIINMSDQPFQLENFPINHDGDCFDTFENSVIPLPSSQQLSILIPPAWFKILVFE
ncbi:MAG: alpha-amylase family glycosyl hydrolase [Anaerolineaceae bacterium]